MYRSFKILNYKLVNKDVITEYVILNTDYLNNIN